MPTVVATLRAGRLGPIDQGEKVAGPVQVKEAPSDWDRNVLWGEGMEKSSKSEVLG
jgi:hypothetical protein